MSLNLFEAPWIWRFSSFCEIVSANELATWFSVAPSALEISWSLSLASLLRVISPLSASASSFCANNSALPFAVLICADDLPFIGVAPIPNKKNSPLSSINFLPPIADAQLVVWI